MSDSEFEAALEFLHIAVQSRGQFACLLRVEELHVEQQQLTEQLYTQVCRHSLAQNRQEGDVCEGKNCLKADLSKKIQIKCHLEVVDLPWSFSNLLNAIFQAHNYFDVMQVHMKEIEKRRKKDLCQVAGKKSNCMRLEKLDVPFHIALDQFDHCIDQISQIEGDLDVDHCR